MVPIPYEQALQDIPQLEALMQVNPRPGIAADLAAKLFTVGRVREALPIIEAAWANLRHPGIALNYSLILKDLGRHSESLKMAEAAFVMNSDDDYGRLAYTEGLLKNGFWQQAWLLNDHSRPTQLGAAMNLRLPSSVKEWKGEKLPKDHLLLVINEGGMGDRLSYPRFLKVLDLMGIKWIFYPGKDNELLGLFTQVFPREKLVADGQEMDTPTHWTTAFSLPCVLKVSPSEVPSPLHFKASAEMIEKYKLPESDKPYVGLCWRAAELHQGGKTVRSMTEGQAMRLVCETEGTINWVNLQHQHKMPFPVLNVRRESYTEVMGVIHNLDAVVSVDTSIMHLAGCMDKQTAALLSGNSCWKFLLHGEKCIWYPSVKLYRNEGYGFESAINKLVQDIREHRFPNKLGQE